MSYIDELMATDETVQRRTRRHWIVLFRSLVLNGLGICVTALLAGITTGAWQTQGGWLWSGASILMALLFLGFVVRLGLDILRWAATQYVVTSRRVIEVSGVFNKLVRDSNLDKINDIVLAQSALGRLLNYGDISIITGSDVGVNMLEKIRDPIGFKRTMLDNKEDLDSLVRAIGGNSTGGQASTP